MSFNFPNSPSVGQLYPSPALAGAPVWRWNGYAWVATDVGLGAIYISDTAPSGAVAGSLWWESDTGILYIYYNDGTSSQWVMAFPVADATKYAIRFDTAQTLTATQKGQARANIDALKKNYFLNGAMMISQENGTTAVSAGGAYPVDQWTCGVTTSGTWTLQQVASASPTGSPNRLRFTVTAADAAVAVGDGFYIYQRVEGLRVADLQFGTAGAKAITVQFGCKGPAGTYCVTAINGASNRSYVIEYVISVGEANTDVVKTVTIPGDVTGTWAKDTTVGMELRFGLMAGTTWQQAAGSWGTGNPFGTSNQFNIMGTNGNVFELFDVGLYEGSAAPAFQVPDYVAELALCQRYYEVSDKVANNPLAMAFMYNTGAAFGVYTFKVQKRITPAFFAAGAAADYSIYRSGANTVIDNIPSLDSAGLNAAHVRHTYGPGGLTVGQSVMLYTASGNAQYRFNARL